MPPPGGCGTFAGMVRHRSTKSPLGSHLAQYLLLRGLLALLSRMGWNRARSAGAGLGRFAHDVVRVRRRVTRENLSRAFPEWPRARVEQTARSAYAQAGITFLETFAMARSTPAERAARVRPADPAQFRAAVDGGRGAVLLTAHLGNWELGGASVAALGHPTWVMVARQRNRRVDRLVREARERAGMRVLYTDEGVRPALRALRRGEFVAFLFDQDAGRHGRFVPFFGRPASTPLGPFRFARLARCPIILGWCVRQPDGAYRLEMPGPLWVADDLPPEEAEAAAMERATALLEETIALHPEQWFWMHRRWKSRPPDQALERGGARDGKPAGRPAERGDDETGDDR